MMKSKDLVERAINIARNYKTAYVWGAFGLPASAASMQRMINQYSKNNKYLAKAKAIYGNGFFFDCVGLIKAILWGWVGDASKTYGGAKYTANGVPDISADQMISVCKNISTNFSSIVPGEVVWLKDHIGIYIGNGLAVECTPSWNGGVQITSCNCTKTGYNRRNWTKHGKLPYIDYSSSAVASTKLETGNDIVWELMNGKHKIEIQEVDRAVKALDKAKNNAEFCSLYWILYKLVNGNG